MANNRSLQNLDNGFNALANKHRREIIYALGLQPHSISQLATMRNLSLPAIYKHIKMLELANFIKRKKIKQTREQMSLLLLFRTYRQPYDREFRAGERKHERKKRRRVFDVVRRRKGAMSVPRREELRESAAKVLAQTLKERQHKQKQRERAMERVLYLLDIIDELD